MTVVYNENDPVAAFVLQHLADSDIIARGRVDNRSIKDIDPIDLEGVSQFHAFAGAGLWSLAARLAGWPDDRQLWTGSCPCQPFSQAGKGAGTNDARHLWPDFFRLIRACRPPIVVGEQVAGSAGYGWLDGVRADLESEGYTCRAVDIPACAMDAPHIRNRIYWVAVRDMADADRNGRSARPWNDQGARYRNTLSAEDGSDRCAMADADSGGRARRAQDEIGREEQRDAIERVADASPLEHAASERRGEGRPEPILRGRRPAVAGADAPGVTLGDAIDSGLEGHAGDGDGAGRREIEIGSTAAPNGGEFDMADASGGRVRQSEPQPDERAIQRRFQQMPSSSSYWSDAEWIICHDGKARRTKPGLRLLVNGMARRTDLWRLAGNSIVPQVAAEVLKALMETLDEQNQASEPPPENSGS